MGLTAIQLNGAIDALAARDDDIARALGHVGYPEPRIRERGYATMLRTIVGQQVSVHAANAVWNRLEAALGEGCPHEVLAAASEEALRACGLSRQKQGYARSLAALVGNGEVVLGALPADDEEAIALLDPDQGDRALVGGNLFVVRRRARRHLAGRRSGGAGGGRPDQAARHAPRRKGDARAGRRLAPLSRRGGDLRLAFVQG